MSVTWFFEAKPRKAADTKATLRAEKALEVHRASLPAYRELLDTLASATGRPSDEVWQQFSQGFLHRGSVDDGIERAFEGDPRHLAIDWKDLDTFAFFAHDVRASFPEPAPFDFDPEGLVDPVESGLQALAVWLRARDHALLNVGSDSDTYSCFVLPRDAAETLLRADAPHGLRVFAF